MSILSINTQTTGLVGKTINPRRCTMITTDNLATITTAGYLNSQNNAATPIFPTDVFEVLYSFNEATQDGTLGFFTVSFSNGNFTLSLYQPEGGVSVTLPTVTDNVPFWDNTSGKLDNTGYPPSSVSADYVCMVSGSTFANTLPRFNDTTGTIEATNVQPTDYDISRIASVDGPVTINNIPKYIDTAGSIGVGYAVSDSGLTVVAGVNGATVVGHAAEFDDITGSVIDSGQRVPFSTPVSGAGGGITNPVTVTGAAIGDTAIYTGLTCTNNVASTLCAVTAPNEVTVVFTADPGSFTGKVLLQKAP